MGEGERVLRDSEAVAHVVALSGGKDSTAMALALREAHPSTPFNYVCTPTGDELPEMLAHWEYLEGQLGRRLIRLTADVDLNGLIERFSALPNHRMRWCTRILKILPFKAFIEAAIPAVAYVGLRADEEQREGGIYGAGVTQAYPLRDWEWGIWEVMDFLEKRGVKIPPRTDCARCYHQRLGEWWELWKQHPKIYDHAAQQEARLGRTFRSEQRDVWPAALIPLREEFEKGAIPRNVELQLDFWQEDRPICRVCRL